MASRELFLLEHDVMETGSRLGTRWSRVQVQAVPRSLFGVGQVPRLLETWLLSIRWDENPCFFLQ